MHHGLLAIPLLLRTPFITPHMDLRLERVYGSKYTLVRNKESIALQSRACGPHCAYGAAEYNTSLKPPGCSRNTSSTSERTMQLGPGGLVSHAQHLGGALT